MPFNPNAVGKAKADLKKALAVLEQHLAGKKFLVGDGVTLADICLSEYFSIPSVHVANALLLGMLCVLCFFQQQWLQFLHWCIPLRWFATSSSVSRTPMLRSGSLLVWAKPSSKQSSANVRFVLRSSRHLLTNRKRRAGFRR
jgi:glutathione S-transferase